MTGATHTSRVAHQRLRRQRLISTGLPTPRDAVAWLGAVQSQEYAVARWSIGQRTRRASDDIVLRSYADGAILRTHMLRPTWHFVTPADIRWMLALTAPRVQAQMAGQHRRIELPARLFARANDLIARALEDGVHCTRVELQAILAAGGIHVSGQRLGHVMMMAELDQVVCSGVPKGKQHTYARFEERVPGALSLADDEALAALARRYLASHGPASERDLARWASLTLADARRAVEMLGRDAEAVRVAGDTWWQVGAPPARSRTAPEAHLLQVYDEYIGGYANETRRVADPANLMHATPAVRTPFLHAIVLDGQVVGHWRPSVKGRAGSVDVRLAVSLKATQHDAVTAAVERYRRFFDPDPDRF